MKKEKVLKNSILLFLIMTISIMFLLSCTAGVDLPGLNTILTSFTIEWPVSFDNTCNSAEAIEVIINAIDQNGELLNWSGTVNIELTNSNISVNPSTVALTNGVVQRNISFVNSSSGDEQTQIKLSYGDVITTFEDIILVIIPSDYFTLTITNDGKGNIEPSGDIIVGNGVPTNIFAEPSEGYVFASWSVENGTGVTFGNQNAAETTATLTVEDATIQANFKVPPAGSIIINSDDTYTATMDVTLTISAEAGSGVVQMMISNDSGFTGASWETYDDTPRAWEIGSGDCEHFVQ